MFVYFYYPTCHRLLRCAALATQLIQGATPLSDCRQRIGSDLVAPVGARGDHDPKRAAGRQPAPKNRRL